MCQLLNGVSRELGSGSRATKEQIGKFNDTLVHHRALMCEITKHIHQIEAGVSVQTISSLSCLLRVLSFHL